jgi:hypothetical protein
MSVIIPTWHYRLAAEAGESAGNSWSAPAWTLAGGKWPLGLLLAIPPLIVWICGSGYLMRHLWKTHPLDSSRKKTLWTAVLVIPVIGWMLYGQFYGESQNQENWIKIK